MSKVLMAPITKDGSHILLNDGHLMPLLGIGTWQAKEASAAAVECALKNGYKLIDTAYTYENEEAVGEGIRCWGGDRKDVFVVTKLPTVGMRSEGVEKYLKMSLTKLGLEYVDLYLIHCPIGLKYVDDETTFPTGPDGKLLVDYSTDHIAIWKAMEAMKAAGLARSIGVSNFNTGQLRRLLAIGKVRPAVNQLEMHLEFQQIEMQDFCNQANIALTSYGTLGSPGRKGTPFDQNCVIPALLENPVVGVVAAAHSATPAQVLIRYFVQKGVAVIPKSVTPSRIIANAKILDWQLSEDEMAALRSLDRGQAGRTYNFMTLKGMELHPECPVNKISL